MARRFALIVFILTSILLPVFVEFWIYIVYLPESRTLLEQIGRWTAWPVIILYVTLVVMTIRLRISDAPRKALLVSLSNIAMYIALFLSPGDLSVAEKILVSHTLMLITTVAGFMYLAFRLVGRPGILLTLLLLLPLGNLLHLASVSYHLSVSESGYPILTLVLLCILIVQGIGTQYKVLKEM